MFGKILGFSITTTVPLASIAKRNTGGKMSKNLSDLETRKDLPRPLGVLVMIREEKMDDKTKGGILLPTITKETQFLGTGVVISCGEGFYDNGVLIAPNVKPGERVLYPKTSANVYKDGVTGDEFVFIATGNLICVLPPKAN